MSEDILIHHIIKKKKRDLVLGIRWTQTQRLVQGRQEPFHCINLVPRVDHHIRISEGIFEGGIYLEIK